MEISHIPRRYTSSPATITSTVSGPLAFIKLALEELKVPFVYFKRGLKVGAGTGASFTVQHFDINDTNMINHLRAVHRADYFPLEEPDPNQHANGNETYLQILPSSFKKDQWLIAKHIAPINKQERDMIELDENHSSAIRLASISLEMRILAHEPLRKHPNIVDILAFTWEKIPDELSRRWPILVMEDADCGTLADMNEFGVSPLAHLQNALGIACDVASGLAAIHACGVVHSDLKFENILIFEQPDGSLLAKISDFGLSLVVPDLEASGVDLSTGVQLPGFTRPWEAPESYNTIPLANVFKVDVFAFGLLFSRLMAKGQDIFARYHNQYAIEVNDLDNCYDFEGIFDLKQGDKSMIDHAHQFIKSHNDLSESELQPLLRVAELTLHTDPELRSSMEDLVDLVCTCAQREPIICDEDPLPLLFGGDSDSNELPEAMYKWNRDLIIIAGSDIITDLLTRSRADICSSDPARHSQGAYRLFNLAKWALAGDLGPFPKEPKETCIEWFLEAAESGNIEARSTVFNIHGALGYPFPSEKLKSLEEWLVDACVHDENPGQQTLMELFPHLAASSLQTLRDTYCGYGQDCFGEEWRSEYALESPSAFLELILHSEVGINDLHETPDSACGMTWLHYAASCGRVDIVRLLVEHGSSPDILNGYGETPLFMACQAGRFEVAHYLCPLTQPRTGDEISTTELHCLDRFEKNVVLEVARMLVARGADINAKDDDLGLTPLSCILNRNGLNALPAAIALLECGADPLVKDQKGIDSVAQAAFNFSLDQIKTIIDYIPEERILPAKVEALWYLLELEYCECLIRGGQNFLRNATEVLDYLCDTQVLLGLESKTHHPVFTLACASSPLELIRILLQLRSTININEVKRSAKEYDTPLQAAIVKNRPQVVDFLLESGADPTLKHPGNDWTPLFYAVTGIPDITRSLAKSIASKISYDAAVQYVNTRDSAGVTAFDTAVIGEFYESADLLLEYKPDFLSFTSVYSDERTTLMNLLGHVFYMANQLEYLLKLLKDPLKGLLIDSDGVTLLHAVVGVTADRTTYDEVEGILNNVLRIFNKSKYANIRTDEGDTPIHYACRSGNVIALKKLEKTFGDDIDWHSTNLQGWTALDEAESRPFRDYRHLGSLAKARYDRRTETTLNFLLNKGVVRSGKGLGDGR